MTLIDTGMWSRTTVWLQAPYVIPVDVIAAVPYGLSPFPCFDES